jgi:hypothetical protein
MIGLKLISKKYSKGMQNEKNVFQGRNQRQDNVNTVMKLRISYRTQNVSVATGEVSLKSLPRE